MKAVGFDHTPYPAKKANATGGWIEKRVARDIDNIGHKDIKIIVKSDQERAVVALQHAIRKERIGKIVCVNSPVGESESNGRVENAIRQVEEKVRTLKRHFEEEIGTVIEPDATIMSWMIRWAGELVSKFHLEKDRKTDNERIQ